MKVRVTQLGYWDHKRRKVGAILNLHSESEISLRWMEPLDAEAKAAAKKKDAKWEVKAAAQEKKTKAVAHAKKKAEEARAAAQEAKAQVEALERSTAIEEVDGDEEDGKSSSASVI